MSAVFVREGLERTRTLIRDPSHWTKGAYARDRHGDPVDPESDEAVQWSLMGANMRATRHEKRMDWLDLFLKVNEALRAEAGISMTPTGITELNDNPAIPHAYIVDLLNRTIASCSRPRLWKPPYLRPKRLLDQGRFPTGQPRPSRTFAEVDE